MMPTDVQPACAVPSALALVDAAFSGSKGYVAAANTLATTYCRRCPVVGHCLVEGMNGREPGVWGGTHRRRSGQVRVPA